MSKSLHHWCCRRSLTYHRWHNHPYHRHCHWGILVFVVFGMIITFAGLGWTGFGVDVQIVNAAIGGNFSTRKAGWVASVATASNLDITPHSARQHVLGWIEDGTHTSCRSSGVLQGAFNQSSACLPNADRGTPCMFMYIDTVNRIEKMEDWGGGNPTYNDLDCIEGNIPGLIRWKGQSGSNAPATLARMYLQYKLNNAALKQYFSDIVSDENFLDSSPSDSVIPRIRDMQPLQTAVHYLAALQAQGSKTGYADRGADFSREFTYEGRKYCPLGNCATGGGQSYPYDALIFTRDWLYKWMDLVIDYPNAETNSRSYQHQAIVAMRLLYDFGEPEMKQRAKMFLDFLFLDSGLQFSLEVNHWGGLFGRTYRQGYAWGGDPMPWYIYWGANNLHLLSQEGFASGYRLSPLVEAFPNVSGGDWILKKDSYRNSVFSTSGFNVAVNPSGNEWRINMRDSSGQGFPFDFWINDLAGDSDPNVCSNDGATTGQGRTVSICGGGECYACLGAGGSLYRNNILLQNLSKPTFHFTGSATSFDEIQGRLQPTADTVSGKTIEKEYFLNNNQWNYFREGKAAVAINPGPGTGGIEVAIVDGSCSEDFCYPSFQDFTSKSRSVGSASFTNGKGIVIDSSKTYVRPSQRLLAETNNSSKYVSWTNRVMTVGYNGTCSYDFNSWTTSPAGCEGQGGSLGTGNPVCPDGLCNGSETQASCPADCTNSGGGGGGGGNLPPNKPTLTFVGSTGGGSCGQQNQSCMVGSCQGKCDATGNQCVKNDPNCGTNTNECSDGVDNDGDTLIDTADPGCPSNNDEANPALVCTPNANCTYTSQNCAGVCSADGMYCTDKDANDNCPNYASGHRYPRLSHTTWGGPVIDWLKRFDLIDNNANNNPAYASAIKSANATTKVVVTRDFQQGLSMEADKYTQWKVTTSNAKGKKFCSLYFLPDPLRNDPGDFYFNYTDLAQSIPTEYGTMRFNQYISRWMTDSKNIDLTIFDGVQTDGLWAGTPYFGRPQCDDGSDNEDVPDGKIDYPADPQCTSKEDDSEDSPVATPFNPCYDDIDLDGNGLNDYQEAGKGETWIDQQIYNGAIKVLQLLRQELDKKRPGLLMIINSGGPHEWGIEYTSGFEHEHFPGHYGFQYNKDVYDNWMLNGFAPQSPILTSDTIMGSPIKPGRNDFQFMRYGLSFALLTGAYYDFADYARSAEHYWVHYYDEYDVDLGYPTGPALPLANGAWIRFFSDPADLTNKKKGGVIITNGNDASPVTVTNAQLQGLSGYDGPYYRFLGGQDPVTNNGQLFDSVTLSLRQPLINGVQPTISDGIVLVRDSNFAVVSDIILDNWNSGTSPGSLSPGDPFENFQTNQTFIDFKQASSCDQASGYYTVRCEIREDSNGNPEETYSSPPYAFALNSSAKAEYTPTIGVAGKYEILEWHGKLSSGAATGVSYAVNGASFVNGGCGGATCSVNQAINEGKWNSLGIFQFPKGSSAKVTILATGASGTVMADAIKFVYRGP